MKRSHYRISSGLAIAQVVAIGLLAIPQACFAKASAHGASGRWFVKAADSDSDSVWFGSFTWASTAKIFWTLPTFTADGAAVPTAPVPFNEPKFTIVGGFPQAIKAFAGYNVTGTGTKKSTATSTGSGSSNVGAVFYGADWTVTASGTGTYDVKAVAKDPWDILPSDLSTITGSTYSVYIPFSMLEGQSAVGGTTGSGFGYDVSYTTASGSTTLLDVAVNGTTGVATASSAFGSNLKFYLEPNSTTAPVDAGTPGAQINASELQGLLSGDINSGGSLSLPINLGIVLSGIPKPTQTFGADGAVAQIEVDSDAFESASAVPEPCTFIVLGAGAAGIAVRRRKRRAQSGT